MTFVNHSKIWNNIFFYCRAFLKEATEELKMTAGNFYVNDKSTGSVVGQQPFGGGRHSGMVFYTKYLIKKKNFGKN